MGRNALQIRRFHARYLVPRDHVSPHSIKGRLDEAVAQQRLGLTLSTALAKYFSTTDESVWLIRKLELDLGVNAAWERDQLTCVISAHIARIVMQTIEGGDGDENVLRFANRAEYLARFLSDLATGIAWSKWCYDSFAGLRLLPASAALRTAVCDDIETGEAALLQLPDHELNRVLRVLTRQDARRTLESLASGRSEAGDSECCLLAWTAARTKSAARFVSANEWQAALHLYLVASRDKSEARGLGLKRAVIAILHLTQLPQTSSAEREALISALTSESQTLIPGSVDSELLEPLAHCSRAWVREVVETLIAEQKGPADTETEANRRHTWFGGIFLLLPLLDELPLAEATPGWPDADDLTSLTLVRFLLLIKCCGPQTTRHAFYDPLLRDLFSIPPSLSPAVIYQWSKHVTTENLQSLSETLNAWWQAPDDKEQIRLDKLEEDLSYLALPLELPPALDRTLSVAAQYVMRSFAWRLPGFAASSLPYLWSNFLDFSASFEVETDRRVVRLGRPVLHLVFGLTGMHRQSYKLSWLDECPLSLFPED